MNALARMKARLEAKRKEHAKLIAEKEQSNETTSSQVKTIQTHTENTSTSTKTGNSSNMDIGNRNRNMPDSGSSPNNDVSGSRHDTTSGPNTSNVATSVALNKDEVSLADLNVEQRAAVSMTNAGESFCLIGPAGSGKTTTVRSIGQSMIANNGSTFTDDDTTRKFAKSGMPRIAILSFTNQAVRNIKGAMPAELKLNCSTIHNLLEFVPVDYEDPYDLDEYDNPKTKQVFAPTYGSLWNQAGGELLPHIDLIVIEEAGSVALELFELLWSALPDPERTQWIFLGDLNQLPPVFDDAILGFKQLELPVVELVQTYRNVGIITKLAHRILEGKPISDKEAAQLSRTCPTNGDTIEFRKFHKKYGADEATLQLGTWLKRAIIAGDFDPDDTVVLIPFNKSLGTVELNKYIMQGISQRDNLEVYEVITRFGKSYHSIGDKVLHDRNYYRITKIEHNKGYTGEQPVKESVHLTRFGTALRGKKDEVFGDYHSMYDGTNAGADDLLAMTLDEVSNDKTIASSHTITLEAIEFDSEITISNGNITKMLPAYCLTVHKAQGSEFPNVLLILHHTHSVMATRELIYTGITRARVKLTLMYSGNYTGSVLDFKQSMLYKCLVRQAIEGKTAKDKLKHFKLRAKSYIAGDGKGKMRDKLIQLRDKGALS